RGTVVGGVRLDFGRVAPRVRVLLGLSYFKGEFDQRATAELARRLRAIVNDPDSNFSIDVGRIQWSDLTGDVDLQYVLPQGRTVEQGRSRRWRTSRCCAGWQAWKSPASATTTFLRRRRWPGGST